MLVTGYYMDIFEFIWTNNKRLLAALLCICVAQLATYYCKTHPLDHNQRSREKSMIASKPLATNPSVAM